MSRNQLPLAPEIDEMFRRWQESPMLRRENIVEEMRGLDQDHVIGALSDLLSDPNTSKQTFAIYALRRMDSHRAIDLLIPLLESSDVDMRWFICEIMALEGDERAVDALIQVLKSDYNPGVRLMAALALGRIGDPRAISALQDAVESDRGEDEEGRKIKDIAQQAIEEIGKAT